MKRNGNAKRLRAALAAAFFAALMALLFTGCKDLFHPDDDDDDTVLPSDYTLAQYLTWLKTNAVEGGNYSITVKNNETIGPQTLSYSGKNVNITLDGGTAERIVSLSSTGSLFTVDSGVTLTLDNNITLRGRSNNTASLVQVNNWGTLEMNTGSKVTGNTYSYSYSSSNSSGGGVSVAGGTFTMSGGTISGNSASNVGGVYVGSDGTFTMRGGTISGNSANYNAYASGNGGGVGVTGTFRMSGGTISSNFASNWGGGVLVFADGTFIKQSDGVIYGSDASASLKNTATDISGYYGHAVFASTGKLRNSTAGQGVTLDSRVSGSAGGWE
ncbi:MAG: hypothetical protein LBH85_02595 [Treponema sp.]|jgi:hypothetical protein|nr:hypothetical protein [Treponema sp.]